MNKIPSENTLFGRLFGKFIRKVQINKNDTILKFVVSSHPRGGDQENVYYFAEADCCSESWFENPSSGNVILPNVWVADAFCLGSNQKLSATRQDYDELKHLVFKFSNDTILILCDLRNSSNGYYSGSVRLIGNEEEFFNSKWVVGNPKKEIFRDWIFCK